MRRSRIVTAPPREVTSLDARRAERRGRLIAAAADVYGFVGYRNATVRLICRRAELTERYFYESFDSSEELLVVTARTLARRTLDAMRTHRDSGRGSVDARTRRMFESYFRSQIDEPSKARVFTLEFRGISAAADAEFDRILDRFGDLLVETRDPQRKGRIANDPLALRGIVGGVLHIAIAWIEGGYRQPIDEVVDAAVFVCSLVTSRRSRE